MGQIVVPSAGLPGVITPAVLAAGTTQDYAPAGFPAAGVIRQAVNAAGSTIGGLAGGTEGKVVTFFNISVGGAQTLTFTNEDAGSIAANRFTLPAAGNSTISNISSASFRYDSISARWRMSATTN